MTKFFFDRELFFDDGVARAAEEEEAAMDSVAPTAGEREDGRKDAHAEWEASDGEAPGWEAAEKERGTCCLRSVRIAQAQLVRGTCAARLRCCAGSCTGRF